MFSGPDYTFEQRWVARVATFVLFIPFAIAAYGIGYGVGIALVEAPIQLGFTAVGIFLLYNSAIWFYWWCKGFPPKKRVISYF